MSVVMRSQGKAQELAREIVSGWDVGDLECLITDHMEEDERRRILAEIEPKYDALEKEMIEISRALEKCLTNKKHLKMVNRHSEIQRDLSVNEAIAEFHLGFAAALRLLGRKS